MQIPEYIEIRNPATGKPVAFLSPESDGLNTDTATIDNELNGPCVLEFELPVETVDAEHTDRVLTTKGAMGTVTTPADPNKRQYLTNQYRIIAGGREFVIANPDATDISRDGQKKWEKIRAQESWVLLGKKYATISNDPQTPTPPALAVIILSGGSDLSGGLYAVGSAGHALYALLQGTGWTVGTVDVGGTFDLETEKESILTNINKVQELWGGFLAWDSLNKTVSLRSESTWLNYTSYGIRYAKNLKTINRIDDENITTKLFPFGADDLNIGSVNGGIIYLTNNSYSSEGLTDVWINQDIKTPQALKDAATAHLAKICKPRHTYKVEMLDLRTIPGYEHETFDIGHLIDLADEELGINDRARIIRYKHRIFQPWVCSLDVGDPLKKIQSSIANSIKAADFVKSSIKPNTGFQNLLKAIINTAATPINGATGNYTCIDGVSTWLNPNDGSLTRITPEGLIISSDGGLTWQTAIDGNGFYGNAAWVEKITAAALQIGAATTYESGYNPYEKSANYVTDTDPSLAWSTPAQKLAHANDTWYAPTAKQLKQYLYDQNSIEPYTQDGAVQVNGVGGYIGSSFTTKSKAIKLESFELLNSSSNQYNSLNISLWKLDDAYALVEQVATGTAIKDNGFKCTLNQTLNANTKYAIIVNCPTILGEPKVYMKAMPDGVANSNEYIEGIVNHNYNSATAPAVGTTLSATTEYGLKLNTLLDEWQLIEDAVAVEALTSANSKLSVGMGVDDNCTLLCHFDGSLNSHKGLTPTFTRNSVAYLSDGTQVAAGVPRFENGKFGKGWHCEEGTTNLLTANQSSVETDLTGFGVDGSGVTLSRVTTEHWNGTASIRVQTTQDGTGVSVANTGAGAGTYTFSVWLKGTGNVQIIVWDGTSGVSSTPFALTPTWTRHTITGAVNTGSTIYGYVRRQDASGADFYCDGLQVVQKPYPASWQIGGTVRPGETLSIPTAGIFEKGNWTISKVFVPTITPRMDSIPQYLWIVLIDGNNYIGLRVLNGKLQLLSVSGGTVYAITDSVDLSLNTQCTITASGNGAHFKLYKDGVQIGSDTAYVEPVGALPATMDIGHYAGMYQANGIIDELRIDKVCRPPEVIRSWYNAQAPFYSSQELAQLPGYVKVVTDGIEVYDATGALRVKLGSWVEDLLREYGLQVFNGRIYSSSFKTATKTADNTYIEMASTANGYGYFRAVNPSGKKVIEIGCSEENGAVVFWNGANWTGELATDATNQRIKLYAKDWPLLLNAANSYINIANNGAIEINPDGTAQIILNSPTYVTNGLEVHDSLDVGANTVIHGNLNVGGQIRCDDKLAVQYTENYGERLLNAVEAPEVLYYDRGIAYLQNGEATVYLDPIFLECIEPDTSETPWIFTLSCYGENDVYISDYGQDYFKVKERNGGISNNKFSWKLEAIRSGWANIRLREVVE